MREEMDNYRLLIRRERRGKEGKMKGVDRKGMEGRQRRTERLWLQVGR